MSCLNKNCKNIGSDKCIDKLCKKCCNNSDCKRHLVKTKIEESIQESIYILDTNEKIDEIKNVLSCITFNNKYLAPDIIYLIVDEYLCDMIKCNKCLIKYNCDVVYMNNCAYCDLLYCEDCELDCKITKCWTTDCYYCKKGICFNSSLKWFCKICNDDGIVSEEEVEDEEVVYEQEEEEVEESEIKQPSKCSCGLDIKYICNQISELTKCYNCRKFINKKKYTSYTCSIDCKYFIDVDKVKKKNNKIYIESFVDKDECGHCGRRNMTDYLFELIEL